MTHEANQVKDSAALPVRSTRAGLKRRIAFASILAALGLGLALPAPSLRAADSQPAPTADPDRVVLADFEHGLDLFKGAGRRDDTVAHTGKASMLIIGDFTLGKAEGVYTSRFLRLRTAIRELRFWVRTETAKGLTVQLIDATGQTHQQRLTLVGNGDWEEIVLTTFTGPEHWAGANDGVFHMPPRKLQLVLAKVVLNDKRRGELWFDGLTVVPEPVPAAK